MSKNVSCISVATLVSELSALYTAVIQQEMKLPEIPGVFLWGSPGIGKSSAVCQIAGNVEKDTGRTVIVTDVRLQLFSPVDINGIPVVDAEKKFAKWLRPKIFDLNPDENVVNILFLDELSSAPPAVQRAAYQIVLDRAIGEHRFPENTIVMAAGNPFLSYNVEYQMPAALANRFMHFEIKGDFESFRDWAVREQLHPFVTGYLSFDSSKLCIDENHPDKVGFPTPRSWKNVSTILKASGASSPDKVHHLISGIIGLSTALEFEGWCKVYKTLPDVDEIFRGRGKDCPARPDVMYALLSSLIARITAVPDLITDRELENVCQYVKNFPVDFAARFYRDMMSAESIRVRLINVGAYREWMKRNRRFM